MASFLLVIGCLFDAAVEDLLFVPFVAMFLMVCLLWLLLMLILLLLFSLFAALRLMII